MRILVTGGAGFIGSRYVRGLLADEYAGYEGAHVTVLDKLTYAGNRSSLPPDGPRLTFAEGDIRDRELLDRLLPGQDAVVHFAAESHVDRSLRNPSEFALTNVVGTQSLLDACLAHDVHPVVHVSTDEVYGSIDSGTWDENEPLLPNSPYAASKAGSDLMARAYWRTHGLDVRITRCSNNYGPYQHPEKLIPHFITQLLSDGTVPLYGDGGNRREWIHVDDHCRAVHLVLTGGVAGGVYNVGGGTELSNREMTERLLALCDADWDRVRNVPDRKGHDLRYALDDSKIRDELGFEPAVPFGPGLAAVVQWYRDNPLWWKGHDDDREP
ncbi:dTDP-glucose 4,6-dehydratase [Kineosporia sp. NBRC 101731]|uniref:dTDP-glucose 4,6-dehydratase n=1 Tax=Kineosporia sp. NBRC 101731 TaxID=3032199 RepID=UPI0024A53CB8|nr:dTDP-glucose 4,6-dehydratase [Kineosporia sp. NBRC 101731]GLY32470.1 dTDP-glucose 4,6-dehydratase [Kineosporia sp. NBRC 101731]